MTKHKLISLLLLLVVSFGSFSLYKIFLPWVEHQTTVEGRPVFWLSETELVLLADKNVIVRTLDFSVSEEVIFEMPEEFESTDSFHSDGCFTDSLWRLGWWRSSRTGRSSDTSNYEIYVADGNITGFQRLPPDIRKKINPFDCLLVNPIGDEGLMASSKANFPPIKFEVRNALFSAQDAQNVRLGSDFGTTVIEYENDGGDHRLELKAPAENSFRWDRWSRVERAVTGPRYLFYGAGVDLGGKPDRWPMVTWLTDLEQNTATRVELPKGPWVREYSEKLKCFSCGCGCYRKLDLYPVGSKIYGHVWGIGYPPSVQGIYSFDLSSPENTWEEVVSGVSAKSVSFSRSGCKLAYATSELIVLDLC